MEYIYLHGFLSSHLSDKAKFFNKSFLKYGINLHVLNLNDINKETVLTLSEQVQYLFGYINRLKSDDITLIGSSMGGLVALQYANIYHNIKQMVLLAPALDFETVSKNIYSKDTLINAKQNGFLTEFHPYFKKDIKINYSLLLDAISYKVSKITVDIPILLFHGKNDESVPLDLSIDFAKSNSKCELHILQSDHKLLNQLDTIWDITSRFLELPKTNAIIEVMKEIDLMTFLPRSGYLLAGIKNPETLSEHSYNTTFLAMLIIDSYYKDIDCLKALKMAMLHDIVEIRIMDLPLKAKQVFDLDAIDNAEEKAFKDLLSEIEPFNNYIELWKEYKENVSLEAKIVNACDKLQMMIKVSQYEKQGNYRLEAFWTHIEGFNFYGIKECQEIYNRLKSIRD